MGAPILSHLDPEFVPLLDDVRARLGRVFQAPEDSLTIAVSGTGTSGMETTVANLVKEGTRVLVVVGGYFGERLAGMCRRSCRAALGQRQHLWRLAQRQESANAGCHQI